MIREMKEPEKPFRWLLKAFCTLQNEINAVSGLNYLFLVLQSINLKS